MTTVLIVLVLLALAVGIVVWFTRGKSAAPHAGLTPAEGKEQDVAWNDPVTPTADPFANAPHSTETGVRDGQRPL